MMSGADQSHTKKSQGRRKVNMVKIEKESNLQVTFSKRRAGLFKKASEICTLTGAQAAVVVFSPGNKVYSFGHPNVRSIANRFLAQNSQPENVANQSVQAHQISQKSLERLAEVERHFAAAKAKKEELIQMRKAGEREKWIPSTSMSELNFQQLMKLSDDIIDFGRNLGIQVNQAVNPIIPYSGTSFDVSSGDMASGSTPILVPYQTDDNTVIPYDPSS